MKQYVMMVIAFLVMLCINWLGNAGHINGQSQQEISDKLTVLFTPAGYVFSIWGLIYLLVAVWLVMQFIRRKKEPVSATTAYLFIGTCIWNIAWLVFWHYEIFIIAQLMMFLLLVNLIVLYMRYPKGDKRVSGRLPFSFYLGWISVATIANMAYTLKHYDVTLPVGEVTGTILLVILALLLGVATLFSRRDPFYAIVFIWSFIGIGIANDATTLVMTTYVSVALLAIAIVAFFFWQRDGQARR